MSDSEGRAGQLAAKRLKEEPDSESSEISRGESQGIANLLFGPNDLEGHPCKIVEPLQDVAGQLSVTPDDIARCRDEPPVVTSSASSSSGQAVAQGLQEACEIKNAAERASVHWGQVRTLLEDTAVLAGQCEVSDRRPEVVCLAAGRRDATLLEILNVVRELKRDMVQLGELKSDVDVLKRDMIALKDSVVVIRMILDTHCREVSREHRKIMDDVDYVRSRQDLP